MYVNVHSIVNGMGSVPLGRASKGWAMGGGERHRVKDTVPRTQGVSQPLLFSSGEWHYCSYFLEEETEAEEK